MPSAVPSMMNFPAIQIAITHILLHTCWSKNALQKLPFLLAAVASHSPQKFFV